MQWRNLVAKLWSIVALAGIWLLLGSVVMLLEGSNALKAAVTALSGVLLLVLSLFAFHRDPSLESDIPQDEEEVEAWVIAFLSIVVAIFVYRALVPWLTGSIRIWWRWLVGHF